MASAAELGAVVEERAVARHRFLRWLIFGVLFALVPLFFSWVARKIRAQPNGLHVLLANGELFLITAGVSGTALGELVGVVRRAPALLGDRGRRLLPDRAGAERAPVRGRVGGAGDGPATIDPARVSTRSVSGNMTYYLWGPDSEHGDVLIAYGQSRELLERHY